MDSSTQLKTTFEPETVIQPIFTRGNVALSRDGRILASCVDEDTVLTDLQTGVQLAKIEGVGSSISPECWYWLIQAGWRDCN
jgi:U3 small nucleolar RNA-associated protein 13